jgi:eukaryotic-like serine/threonine-protein kinase
VTPELLHRAESEFHRIAGLAHAEQAQALRTLEQEDAALAALVQSLLDADRETAFMQSAPAHEWMGAGLSTSGNRSTMPVRIGRYRIVGVLGEGGMGLVYEAQQDVPSRRVALKVMRSGLATRETISRFQREAELLGSLKHPGIAAIYDAGWARPEFEDGPGHEQPFLAMELIRGSGFLEACRRLSVRDRLELFARVCDAVGFAHARGIVHRDLKPSNVLVDETGAPKVLDFGVARVTEASSIVQVSMQTEVGRVIGTLGYIAPEQHGGVGAAAMIDQRADVYALGVMLFETLTGRTPHELHHYSLADAARIVRDEEPTRLSMIDRSLRGDLDTIVSKAIEKDPSRRYGSAAALGADIRRYLRDETIAARPASAMYRLRKFTRRHRGLVVAVSAVFVALSAGLVVSIWFAARELIARRDMDLQRQRAESEAYRANIAAAQAALLADDGAMALGHLDRTDPALRGWEYHHVRHVLESWVKRELLPKGSPANLVSPPDRGPLVSFDGARQLTIFNDAGPIRSVNIPQGSKIGGIDAARKAVAFTDGAGRVGCLEIGPDAGEAVTRWVLPEVRGKWSPGISPDGKLIAAVEADETQVAVYDALTGAETRRLNVRASFPPPAFAPDGRTLLVSRLEASVTAIDWPSGEPLWERPAGFQSFSADGSLAALTATAEGRSWAIVADVRTGAELGRVPIGGSLAWGAARAIIRPDGGVLAVVDSKGLITLWDLRTWQRLAKLHTPSPVQSLRYDGADGEFLTAATRSEERIVWPAAVATAVASVPPMQTAPTATAISPSGNFAAIVDWGSVSVWDTRTLRPLWRKSVEPRSLAGCSFAGEDRVVVRTVAQGAMTFDAMSGAVTGEVIDGGMPVRSSGGLETRVNEAGEVVVSVGGAERTLRATAPVLGVAVSPGVSPGGSRVAGVCRDGSITIWDVESGEPAAHLRLAWTNAPSGTSATDQGRYAVSVSFRGEDESRAALVVASYAGLSVFETRSAELERLGERDRSVRAHGVVDPLLRRHHSAADARAAILSDASLSPALRREALAMLDVLGDHAATLNSQAWSRVASPMRTAAEAAKGLELAARAAELLPESTLVLNTLAVAQWRTVRASEALATVRRIEELSARSGAPISVIDLAIGTMAAEAIADPGANELRRRLREARAAMDPAKDPEGAAFAREAGE